MQLLRRILDGDTPHQPTTANRCLDVLANLDGPGGWKATDEVTFSVAG